MEDRIGSLEAEIRKLAQILVDLEGRVAALESHPLAEPRISQPMESAAPEAAPLILPSPEGFADSTGMLSLAGRFFIVMGGAYLLRALTEASTLTPALGVSLGLAYALIWSGAAERAAARGRWWSGVFHSAAAALTAFPILWEAAARFRILRTPMDAWLLAILSAVMLGIAYRRKFQPLAWFTTVGALLTAISLMFAEAVVVPYAVFLIVLGVATLWLGYELEWRGLRWPVAFAANLAVLGLTLRALAEEPREDPAAALSVQLFLLGLYLSSIAVRTLVRERNVIPFEVVQVIACFLLGFVGAVYTTKGTGFGTTILGAVGVVLGAACYAVAFAFVDKKLGRGRNFYFYTSLALLFALTASALLLQGTALSLAWILLACLMAWLGWRHSRLALTLHSTVSIVAASFFSGLAAYSITGLVRDASLVGAFPTAAMLLVLGGAAFYLCLPLQAIVEGNPTWFRIQRLVITIVFIGGMGGMLDSVIGRMCGSLPNGGVDPGILATVRTLVLSISALGLAWVGRHSRFADWGKLVYPVLGLTLAKIMVEDFRQSRPATLLVALPIYGLALIISPRLRKKPDSRQEAQPH